jgi:hypothetical protein
MDGPGEPDGTAGRSIDVRRGGEFDACRLWVIEEGEALPETWWARDNSLLLAAGAEQGFWTA